MSTATFFDRVEIDLDKGRGGVARDGRGRALLAPRGLAGTKVRVPYSSASGLADAISDDGFLHRWEKRYLAIAMGRNADLARLAAAETYHTGLEPLDVPEKRASGRRVDDIIQRALDRQRIHEKADYGTAFHAFTEPGALPVPEGMDGLAVDVKSFEDALRENCITLVDTERFTANDTTMSAGTYDHGVRVLGHPLLTGYVIADKKTGRIDPWHWEIQIASYANSEMYDTETDERSPMPEDVNLNYGVVFHTGAQTGHTEFYVLDLQRGWRNAQIAAQARDAQDEGAKTIPFKPATFAERLAAVSTIHEATRLWYSTSDAAERDAVTQKARSLS